eukprot:scaffold1753_cov139-Ochromonas_danica.AAC.2
MPKYKQITQSLQIFDFPPEIEEQILSFSHEKDRYCSVRYRIQIRVRLAGKETDKVLRKSIRKEYHLSREGICNILRENSHRNDEKRVQYPMMLPRALSFTPHHLRSKGPLDQGIIAAVKRRAKTLLATAYIQALNDWDRVRAIGAAMTPGTAGVAQGFKANLLDAIQDAVMEDDADSSVGSATSSDDYHEEEEEIETLCNHLQQLPVPTSVLGKNERDRPDVFHHFTNDISVEDVKDWLKD